MNSAAIQNDYSKMVLLNNLDKNHILATLIQKESNLLPSKDSAFNLGNQLYKWNILYTNELRNNNLRIIANDIKPNRNAKVGIFSNGNSNDAISLNSLYGGIHIKTGRQLNIESDIYTTSDIINFNSDLKISLSTKNNNLKIDSEEGILLNSYENININSDNTTRISGKKLYLDFEKIYFGSDHSITEVNSSNKTIIGSNFKKLVNNNIDIDNNNANTNYNSKIYDIFNFETQLYVGKSCPFNSIQDAINNIKNLKKNTDYLDIIFKINIINDKDYNENIDIDFTGLNLSGYNDLMPLINGTINFNLSKANSNLFDEYDIIINNIKIKNPSINIKNLININSNNTKIKFSNNIIIVDDCVVIRGNMDNSNIDIIDNHIYIFNNVNNSIYFKKIKKFSMINNFIKIMDKNCRDNNLLVIDDNSAKVKIIKNKLNGLLVLNVLKSKIISNKIKTFSCDELKINGDIEKRDNIMYH